MFKSICPDFDFNDLARLQSRAFLLGADRVRILKGQPASPAFITITDNESRLKPNDAGLRRYHSHLCACRCPKEPGVICGARN